MERNEIIERLTAIGTCEDETERRNMLTALTTEVEKDYDERDKLKTDNAELIEKNEKLRSANMDLFIQVGASRTEPEDKPEDKEDKDEKEKLDFANLFDEKGVLK